MGASRAYRPYCVRVGWIVEVFDVLRSWEARDVGGESRDFGQ